MLDLEHADFYKILESDRDPPKASKSNNHYRQLVRCKDGKGFCRELISFHPANLMKSVCVCAMRVRTFRPEWTRCSAAEALWGGLPSR